MEQVILECSLAMEQIACGKVMAVHYDGPLGIDRAVHNSNRIL